MPFYVRQQSIGLCSEEWLEHRLGALRRNIHLIETVFDSVQAERVPASVDTRGGQSVPTKKPVLSAIEGAA
jgi:hypothetical protein